MVPVGANVSDRGGIQMIYWYLSVDIPGAAHERAEAELQPAGVSIYGSVTA